IFRAGDARTGGFRDQADRRVPLSLTPLGLERRAGQWTAGKSRDTLGPIGLRLSFCAVGHICEEERMARPITSVADLRALARRRVPRVYFDHCDSGSWTESTYRANEADFVPIKLRQRVAVDMRKRTLATTMAGVPVSMPVALAPTGLTGMQHADGEILAARAAEKAGVPFTLSTMSICSI